MNASNEQRKREAQALTREQLLVLDMFHADGHTPQGDMIAELTEAERRDLRVYLLSSEEIATLRAIRRSSGITKKLGPQIP